MTHDEIERIQVGDVLLYGPKRTPRIVRGINRPPDKSTTGYKVYSVAVAIRRCSKYNTAGTYLDRHVLKTKCERTGMRVKLDDAADLLFEMEQAQRCGPNWIMGCCLAKGLPA